MPGRPPLIPARRAAPARVALIVALTLGLAVVAAGCGAGSVRVDPAAPTGATTGICTELVEDLPATVLELAQRPTEPDPATTAAWGDPAITLVCGVPRPAERQGDAQLFEIDGVTWFAQPLTRGTRFTSEGLAANIQVDVPDDYRPEAQALIDLGPAIRRSVPPERSVATD